MRPRWVKMIFMIPIGIAAMLIITFAGGELVKLLWNWLLPPLFGWRVITFWQGLALLALCRILFGGFGGHRGGGHSNFRRRMKERCGTMTPEERERFRQGIRATWGGDPAAGQSAEQSNSR